MMFQLLILHIERAAQMWSLWFLMHNIIIIMIRDLASPKCVCVCLWVKCSPFILMHVLHKFMKFQIRDYLTLYRSFVFYDTHYFYLCDSSYQSILKILCILPLIYEKKKLYVYMIKNVLIHSDVIMGIGITYIITLYRR